MARRKNPQPATKFKTRWTRGKLWFVSRETRKTGEIVYHHRDRCLFWNIRITIFCARKVKMPNNIPSFPIRWTKERKEKKKKRKKRGNLSRNQIEVYRGSRSVILLHGVIKFLLGRRVLLIPEMNLCQLNSSPDFLSKYSIVVVSR